MEKCKSCEQYRYHLNKQGICLLCMNARRRAEKEEGNWIKKTVVSKRGIKVKHKGWKSL